MHTHTHRGETKSPDSPDSSSSGLWCPNSSSYQHSSLSSPRRCSFLCLSQSVSLFDYSTDFSCFTCSLLPSLTLKLSVSPLWSLSLSSCQFESTDAQTLFLPLPLKLPQRGGEKWAEDWGNRGFLFAYTHISSLWRHLQCFFHNIWAAWCLTLNSKMEKRDRIEIKSVHPQIR